MDERKSWLRENWRVGLILVLIAGIAAFLRVYYAYPLFAPAGFWSGGGDYSGGSDPFYWERALLYSFQTGKELGWDYAMNYPIGFPDVRPPLFDWFNLLAGYLASPAFGGNAWNAMVWMLNMNAAIFGVLSLIPTYLIGKEAFNRRAGLLAAFLLAISAASLQRSHATIAVHDSWTLFFVVCAFFFYLRALKTLNRRRWVENWFSRKTIADGLRAFLRENRKSVLYAVLAGLSVSVTALSWQGWAYVPVILVLIFAVEIVLDRIRNQDVMGVTVLFLILLAVPLIVSFPWYSVRNLIRVWWDVPMYLFLVAAALGMVFTVTRDYPWTIVLPATFIAAAAGILAVSTANAALLNSLLSGAGYFIKNKVYQTIAEAQEPGMSELVLNFGWFSFYVGLGAIAFMIWQLPRRNNPAYTMLVLWTAGALFMALSAARFLFNAAPVMALATGYALDLVIARFGFEEMRRTYRSLSEGSWRNAVRKSVKPRHVIIALLLAVLIVLPNAWFAVDAAIPYDLKGRYDKQIESLLPSFLQAPGYASTASGGGTFYLGAFGYSLPTSTQYFPAAYHWLSTQDTNVPLEQRPAVMAWWDYGFEITERGGHPVPADPFQNGYAISGQFILAQNETSAITLLALRLIEGDWRANAGRLSPGMSSLLTGYGISPDQVSFAFKNPTALIPIILNNPNLYGLWDSNLQFVNSPYIYLQEIFLSRLSEPQIVDLYHDVRALTGWSIGYFMVDARLFPISATNTGIFYAPAKLSDHRVLSLPTGQVMPFDFFRLFANTPNAQNVPVQDLAPTDRISSTSIVYQPMFYRSMFYRAYVGYTPSDLGSRDTGIPGLDQALSQYAPHPAWNMTHFRVVYQTAYYNPFKDPANHTTAWRAMNYDQAAALQRQIQAGTLTGVVDLGSTAAISNGAIILAYYDGALVNGTVSVGGVPLAGAHITVDDELGTPHYLTTTDADGRYSALVPFGNITLTASVGTLNRQTLIGATTLTSTTFPVTVAQAMRVNQDLNGDSIPDWLITKDLPLSIQSISGTLYFDLNHDNSYDAGDLAAAGATLRLKAGDFGYRVNATADATGAYSVTNLASGLYNATVVYQGHTVPIANLQAGPPAGARQDVAIPFGIVRGTTVDSTYSPIPGATVTIADGVNETSWQTTSSSDGTYAFQPSLAGNYTLTAVSGELASMPTYLSISIRGLAQNLTLVPSGRVRGTTELFGLPLPYATLRFQSAAQDSTLVSVTSDARGSYALNLSAGDWNVNGRAYIDGVLYATIGRLVIRQGVVTAFDANFVDGARVAGIVSTPTTQTSLPTHIGFLGTAGEWWLTSGIGNAYVAYLPVGAYAVVATAQQYLYTQSANLAASTTLNLRLANATAITGTVYWDRNRNGAVDADEGIAGARVVLTDNLGNRDVAVADDIGTFAMNLFADRTYAGQVTSDGFVPMTINATTVAGIGSKVRWALTAVPVALTGTVYLNGTFLLNRALSLLAMPIAGGAVSASGITYTDGSYSLSLSPGTYQIEVDENVSSTSNAWRYQNLRTDTVTLAVGAGGVLHDLVIAARALVKGNVSLGGVPGPATVTFQGLDNRSVQANATGGFQTYLQAGPYLVGAKRAVGSTEYAVLRNVTLPTSGNVSLALAVATKVAGTLSFGGSVLTTPMTLSFQRREGGTFRVNSTSAGNYSVFLVPGNYTVSVNNATAVTANNVVRYYRYTFQGSLTVPALTPSAVYDVGLARSLDNTTVSGLVTVGGSGADASLTFYAAAGGAMTAQTTSAVDGSYSIGLAPGTYDVYAVGSIGPAGFLRSLTVPHRSSLTYSIGLTPTYLLSGVTTSPDGARVTADLTVSGLGKLTLATDANGAYGILLPGGAYTLAAHRSQTEQGVLVSYQGTASFILASDTVVNLQVGRVDQHSVAVTWDPSQNRTISPGGSVTYSIRVQNTGNVRDSFTLGGSAQGWTFAFAPSSVTLDYGNAPNATYVTVTIQAPSGALVNHAPITLTATSDTDSTAVGSVTVAVGITRVRGLTLQVDPLSGTFDGRYLNYTVNVHNSGNAPETVDVSIQNVPDIGASGWAAALAKTGTATPSGPALTNLTVAANATSSLRLILQLRGANGGATVALSVVAENNPAIYAQTVYTATLPALAVTTGIGVAGPGVTTAPPPNDLLLAAVIGAVAAVGAALVLTRRRR